MASRNFASRKERDAIEIYLFNPNCARIRSDWPVTSPRGKTSLVTELLGKALEEGLEVKRDPKRAGFFEVCIGCAWLYFHVAHKLGRIYLVAALMR